MGTRPIPTEAYPRLIWYQEKRSPVTQAEKQILFNRYYDVSMSRLDKLFPNSTPEKLHQLAEEKANALVESEINLPTIMRKVQVKSVMDHQFTKEAIESADTFLQWYQE